MSDYRTPRFPRPEGARPDPVPPPPDYRQPRSIGPDQLADLRQLVNEPGPVCDIPWAAGPANAMCLRCGNRFDEHTQAQPESEARDE